MPTMKTGLSRLFFALALLPSIAAAQAPKPASKALPPVAAKPERTTASFGDWVLRCDSSGSPAKRVCETAQGMTVQGQTSPIAQIAIGSPDAKTPRQLTLAVPPNLAFAVKPQILSGRPGAAPIELTWQRCTPGACFASGQISDSLLALLGAETEPGRISFKDAADRDATLPLSFRGLSQALDALAKEAN